MTRCVRYSKGDDINNAIAEFRRILFANGLAAMEAQPGDATRYCFTISQVEIPACGPYQPQLLLSYPSEERSLCMQLGPAPYLVPSYMIEKCPGVNPHTACFLCEMVNRIFNNADQPMFDLEVTCRPTENAIENAFGAIRR